MKIFIYIFINLFIVVILNAQWIHSSGPFGYEIKAISILNDGKYVLVGSSFVFLSTDYGISWKITSKDGANCFVFDGNNIYAACNTGVYYSQDNGMNWIKSGLDNFEIYSILINQNNIFAGSSYGYIFKSTDLGKNWDTIFHGLTNHSIFSFTSKDSYIFAGTIGSGIIRSSDNGANWFFANSGLSVGSIFALATSDSFIFAGTNNGVYRSSTDGNFWYKTGLENSFIRDLYFSDTILYAATNTGLYFSTNSGTEWDLVDSSMSFYCTSVSVQKNYLYLGGGQFRGLYRSINRGLSWDLTSILYLNVNSIASSPNYTLAGSIGYISISTDCGVSWKTPIKTGIPEAFWIYNLGILGDIFFAGGYSNFYRSTNLGLKWERVNELSYVRSFSVFENKIFVGTLSGVFVSEDSGKTWIKFNNGLPENDYVKDFTAIDSVIFAGTNRNGVFKIHPSDTQWISISNGLKSKIISSLESIKPYLFAGTYDKGIFRLHIDDTTWMETNNGVDNPEVYSLASDGFNIFASLRFSQVIASSNLGETWHNVNKGLLRHSMVSVVSVCNNYLLAGTEHGVFRRPISEMVTSVSEENNSKTLDYSLLQNFPNPFNPTTTIEFFLPQAGYVELKIFNILGKEISTLVSSYLPAGNNKIVWNAENLPSGVYFYRLISGKYTETKKLLLLK